MIITISNGPYHILCHAPDEVCATLLISLSCNLLQLFARIACLDKLTVNGGEANSDQLVIIEQVEHLIKKPVWLMMDKMEEIVKFEDSPESLLGKANAVENLFKR
ncbi:hypothetical protein AZE42_13460 [Rhizopogon vesiculosus]|uniref:Uncharacterized protein n=1 Tax=Rhizopogon vesiculosus TaxID=180088 RepID=A0A1J8QJR0_9AGAM|nr:hypothetical protein AZE42_13460 [Rhizopogon vesiculosus]